MNLDDAFDAVGNFGTYQRGVIAFNICLGYAITFQMLHMIFIGARPDFICTAHHPVDFVMNASQIGTTSQAGITDLPNIVKRSLDRDVHAECYNDEGAKCKQFTYTSNFTSIVTEWDLVCDDAYEVRFGQAIFMAGVLCGAIFFGPIADKYGRKKSYFFTTLGALVSSAFSAFSTNLIIFLIFRFLAGFFCAGEILANFVLTMEIIGTEWRNFSVNITPIFGSCSIALEAGLAAFIPNWRVLSLVYAAFGFVMLPFFYFLPESPRWLYGRNRVSEAEKLLLKFARKNGKKDITEIHLEPNQQTIHVDTKASLFTLAKKRVLLKITLIQMYSWFVNCVVYYGLTTSAGELGDNMYVSTAVSGFVEIPACILVWILLKFIGRRTACCSVMTLGGLSCLAIMLVPQSNTSVVEALAMTGKLLISASFGIIYLWSVEIFPTVIRNGSMGLMSMSARAGGVISPMINLLENVSPTLPYLIFGILTFSAGVLNYFLPETMHRVLPQTMDDMLRLVHGDKLVDTSNRDFDDQTVQLLDEENMEDEEMDNVVEYDLSNRNGSLDMVETPL